MTPSNLTPEERQKIYLEEKARMEVRQELAAKKTGAGKVIGIIALCIVGLFIVMMIFGSALEQSDSNAYRSLTPAQKQAQHESNCVDFRKARKYKLYSELSVEERQILASCSSPK